MKELFYFAYGSNLLIERLQYRVGEVVVHKTYTLEGWELFFSDVGFANIRPKEGASVLGVLYRLTPKQHKELDFYEGLYVKNYFTFDNGDIAAVYVGIETRSRYGFGVFNSKPSLAYVNYILLGAKAFGLKRLEMEMKAYKKANFKLKKHIV